ncbi:hypothetical protein VTK73DRAFT_8401 [Phialemonium thermophilum]|uniref:Uncharacterized protein n=1 Tax=Phialemonium thermophilum TaxID=223376 RepID=A0ABR3W9M8_9PEZI
MEVLNAAKVKFTMICPFRMKHQGTYEDCGPVVLVTVLPFMLCLSDAKDVVIRLVGVLQRFGLAESAGIELCEGEFGPLQDLAPRDRYLLGLALPFEYTYSRVPQLGASVGPTDLRGESTTTGSLGLFLELKDDVVLAATCHHVVAPGMRSSPGFTLLLSAAGPISKPFHADKATAQMSKKRSSNLVSPLPPPPMRTTGIGSKPCTMPFPACLPYRSFLGGCHPSHHPLHRPRQEAHIRPCLYVAISLSSRESSPARQATFSGGSTQKRSTELWDRFCARRA